MIQNKARLDEFNKNLIENEKLSLKEALSIFESMHKEALALGVLNSENILEGLETNIRIARAINGLEHKRIEQIKNNK